MQCKKDSGHSLRALDTHSSTSSMYQRIDTLSVRFNMFSVLCTEYPRLEEKKP